MNIAANPCLISGERKKSPQRLIDKGLLYNKASSAGRLERYRRGETSHTIHVWWARRPHAAMRPLIYATACKKISKKNIEIMEKLSMENHMENSMENSMENHMENPLMEHKSPGFIEEARRSVLEGYKERPKILDMFGGGGTIPYEALNLGLDSYSADSNELSVFIQKTNLEYSHSVNLNDMTKLIEETGKKIISDLKNITSGIFPRRIRKDGKQTTNYLWTYSCPCRSCGKDFLLSKRLWLSKKKGKSLYLKLHEKHAAGGQTAKISIERGRAPARTNWLKSRQTVQCPYCGCKMSGISIKSAKDRLAVEVVRENKGKSFHIAEEFDRSLSLKIKRLEKRLLRDLRETLPKSLLPKWSGIVNPALYGIESHADIFNPRQRAVCLALLKLLKDEYFDMREKRGQPAAKYAVSVLSGLIDQAVDWNCRMAIWISQNEQAGRAFCGPGISMYWDYNETDPAAAGPANLSAKLSRIIAGARAINRLPRKGHVRHEPAQKLSFPDKMFDCIVTDPPYYDNIFYTVLSDNFYSWKRMLLKHIEPELFKNKTTRSDCELAASSRRSGTSQKAHENYRANLSKAVSEAARVLKDDGAMAFIYSHSSILGWEAIIEPFRHSPMVFSGVQPLSIERRQRPRAVYSRAVNACAAFIAKKSAAEKKPLSLSRLTDSFSELAESGFARALAGKGWREDDISISLMACGTAMAANAARIEGASDIAALLEIERLIKKIFPRFKLNKRGAL